MELSKKFAILALSGVISAGFASCSSDDPEPPFTTCPEGSVTPPSTETGAVDPTVTGVLTPVKAGEYIEGTATKLKQICNPADQQQAVQSLMAIANVLDSYSFGSNDDDDDDAYPYSVAKGVRAMAIGAQGNYANMARAVQNVSQSFDVNPYQYLGVYTPVYDKEEEEYIWTKTAESANAIIFRSEKDKVEVSLALNNGSWSGKFDTTEWDEDYNNGQYTEYEIPTHWSVTVPAKMTMTMSYNGQTAASAVVESNLNVDAHNFSVKSTVNVANIQANAEAIGTDTKITENASAHIGTTRLLYSTGEVKGSSLCDMQKINQLANLSQSQIAAQIDNIFSGATAKGDLLDRIQVSASCNSLRDIVANGDFDDEDLAETNAFVKAINDNVKTTLCFGNTSYEQGTLSWVTMPHETGWGYTWYEIEPMIKLAGGQAMSLGGLIDSGMLNGSINTIQSIIETYMNAFGLGE